MANNVPSRVYLMFSPADETYKIGYSSQDLAVRARQLRRARREDGVFAVHSIECSDPRMGRDVEYLLHYVYREKCVYGEWFNLLPDDVKAIRKFHIAATVLYSLLPIWYSDIESKKPSEHTEHDRRWLQEYKVLLKKSERPFRALLRRHDELMKSAAKMEEQVAAMRVEAQKIKQLYNRLMS